MSFLAGPPARAPYLLTLNLSGTRVTDTGLEALSAFEDLKKLDLARTQITARGVQGLPERLPELEWIDIQSTKAGLLSGWRLQRVLRRRRAEFDRKRSAYLLQQ